MNLGLKTLIQAILRDFGSRHTLMAPPILAAIVLLLTAYLFSFQQSLRGFCPLLIYTGTLAAASVLVAFVAFSILAPERLQSEAHQVQLKALEILKAQSHTGNLKRACLENALAKIMAPLLHRDLEG
jgi:hypothetical protein